MTLVFSLSAAFLALWALLPLAFRGLGKTQGLSGGSAVMCLLAAMLCAVLVAFDLPTAFLPPGEDRAQHDAFFLQSARIYALNLAFALFAAGGFALIAQGFASDLRRRSLGLMAALGHLAVHLGGAVLLVQSVPRVKTLREFSDVHGSEHWYGMATQAASLATLLGALMIATVFVLAMVALIRRR